jgi:hypothetical protein
MTIRESVSRTPAAYRMLNVPYGVCRRSETVVMTERMAKQISRKTPQTTIKTIELRIFLSRSRASRFCL